ncbi:methyltransferase domain-containing protein [Sphingobium lignivorans]|uniref:2-polyprenyl-6-hydroxyphenyl methylase/3-demethylubiquinone-9 3-methyltransferase n=1 Tax=Sphingobium lignivorans TaxID=2735886 RepID=A0ABR6NEH6_9SPHN|nr:methyltransferase domain-containing protein [Sphingobium lignivorans]MBB5985651.1 2-polyprenyl-6-hydroxyphenyl methylase/3-demethylubiquinone-9 3-methyltransferase [Sphingobium lignivorans]
MASIISRFAAANSWLARQFDRLVPYPPRQIGTLAPNELKPMFEEAHSVADVGGGKKPYAYIAGLDAGGKVYVGLDFDPEELKNAPPSTYSETAVLDICAPDAAQFGRFDLIVCRSTLEHVTDNAAAIAGLAALLAPGGKCFVRLPCRRAAFAQLNLRLPNEAKRRMMHAVFPHKKGDGFPAFYNRCLPSQIRRLALAQGLEVIAERRTYRSTYFSFFLPFYLLWRLVGTVQYVADKDYCESFEMVFRKPLTA